MNIQGVITGVGNTVGKPAVKRRVAAVQDSFRCLVPMNVLRGSLPQFGVAHIRTPTENYPLKLTGNTVRGNSTKVV
jgi:hypothetical protein